MIHQQITLQTIWCASHHSLVPSVEGIPLMGDDITLQIVRQVRSIKAFFVSEQSTKRNTTYKHDY